MRWPAKLITCILLGVASIPTFAQPSFLRGTVTDARSGETLPGVNVLLDDGRGTVSNASGNYLLKLDNKEQKIRYRYIGYHDTIITVSAVPGDTLIRSVAMEPEQEQLGTVVVSASRYKQKISEITVSMEVLEPELIEERNTLSLDESLQQVPGVAIIDSEPQIRSGSGYSFGAGSRVMVLVDDLPILSGDLGRPTWGFLPIENVEQVEVIKGASSVLYGSAALSGVINLRTAFPRDEPETKISVFSGVYSAPQTDEGLYWKNQDYRHSEEGFGEISETVDNPLMAGFSAFHSRKVGKWDIVVGANGLADMGYIGPYYRKDRAGNPANFHVSEDGDSLFSDDQTFEKRLRANANIRYRFNDRVNAGVNVNGLTAEMADAFIWFGADTGLYRPFQGSLTRTVQQAFNVDPFFEYRTPDGLLHTFRGRWFHLKNDNSNNQGNENDMFYGEYQVQHRFEENFLPGLRVTAGAVGSYTDSRSELYAANPESDGENNASNFAFYSDVGYKFWDFLQANAGLRYERYSVNSFDQSATIFRTGLSAQLAKATFLRASYGQGYRFPTIGERYIRTTVGTYNIFPNEDLQPETSFNAELGIRQGFQVGNLKGYADVAAFYQEYENFIEFTFGTWGSLADSTINGVEDLLEVIGFRSVNTGDATVRGIDGTLGLQWQKGKWDINVQAGYTYSLPQTEDPNAVYARQSYLSNDPEVTYARTSSNSSDRILKYRFQHLVRTNLGIGYNRIKLGANLRFNSHIQNIDSAFIEFDRPGFVPTDLREWREENDAGNLVLDLRLSYAITEKHKLAVIMNNALNNEYALRPLAIESPRTTMIRYTYHVK